MKAHRPTVEMSNIITASRRQKGLKIIAFAGAGKTTTMQLIAEDLCRRGKSGYYLAFNSSIVEGVEKKMPKGVVVKTFHSLAYNSVSRGITAKLNNKKKLYPTTYGLDFYIQGFVVIADTTKSKVKGSLTDKMYINNYRQFIVIKRAMDAFLLDMTQTPEAAHITSVCDRALKASLNEDSKNLIAARLLPVLNKLWLRYKDEDDEYAISHDVYLKLWALSEPVIDTDFILFDEAQDSDKLMLNILARQKAKIFYVGDPHQQIYEWRGAVNAMNAINLPPYYLTKSFRFGAEIAAYASNMLRYLGETNEMTGVEKESFVDTTTTMPTDANVILCRTNIGAIEAVVKFTNETDIKVVPKNIVLDDTIGLLKQIEQFRLKDESLDATNHFIFGNFKDFDDMIKFCKECPSDNTIAPTIKLYNEYSYDVICNILTNAEKVDKRRKDVLIATTAHKSKGLEWDNVFIWEDFQIMMKYDAMEKYLNGQDSEKLAGTHPISNEEARLLYVTITRAKNKVYAANINVLIRYLARLEQEKLVKTNK